MYENQTFDNIMDRILDRISDSYDKREGSVIYDAVAPAAAEIESIYIELDFMFNEAFADTASRDRLIQRAKERGLEPYPATYAVLKAETMPIELDIPIGSRFNLEDLNYVITEKVSDGEYFIQCESLGTDGNKHFGYLTPIDYIEGLQSIQITELLIPAEDDEDTENFRKRYFDSLEAVAFGGNKADYLVKTNGIAGVGSTKVTPIWDGGGTVLLTILDSLFNKANSVLVESVQEIIDPTQDASGLGLAPIGHIVTVQTADEVTANISTSITFAQGYSWQTLESQIREAVESYMLMLRKEWAGVTNTVVRISQIEYAILAVEGVVDVTDTTINDIADNLTLEDYEIPILGVLSNA